MFREAEPSPRLRITGSGSAWLQPAGSHLRKGKKFTWIAGAAGQGSNPVYDLSLCFLTLK